MSIAFRRSEEDLPQSVVLESGVAGPEAGERRLARAPVLPTRRAPTIDALSGMRAAAPAAGRLVRPASTFESIVGSTDDRILVADPRRAPYRRICALRMQPRFGDDILVGTGWLIGPRSVATAGHCVFDPDRGGWMRSVEVIPGLDGSAAPLRVTSQTFRAPTAWTDRQDSEFDLGVVQLDRPIGEQLGWFGLAAWTDGELTKQPVTITGYPLDRGNASRQYEHSRNLLVTQPHRIEYDIDTYGGQSGAPIWLREPRGVFAVGIHTVGGFTQNAGTRITEDVLELLLEWAFGGEPSERQQVMMKA